MRVHRRAPRVMDRLRRPLGIDNVRQTIAFIRTMHRIHRYVMNQLRSQSPDSLRLARAYVGLTGDLFSLRPRTFARLAVGRDNWLTAQDGQLFKRSLALARQLERCRRLDLAAALARRVVVVRPKSRAAWRVLAVAYHDRGDEVRAVKARRRGWIGGSDQAEKPAVVAVLDEIRTGVRGPSGDPAAALSTATGDVVLRDRAVDAEYVARACAVHEPLTLKGAQGAAAVTVRAALADAGPCADWVPGLAASWASSRGGSEVLTLSEEAALAVRTVDLGGFREYLDGKSVALVANSQRVAGSGAGTRIDGYDVVVRFNSFRLDPANTGSRTSVHAAIHLHDYNWSVPVDVRVVFSGKRSAWRDSIVRFLDPGAQTYLGDTTLRWPVRDPVVLGETGVVDLPTSGFNMLRLVDFLDVCPTIDLIGFDFNASGPYRLPEAMSLPVAKAHDYDAERDWVMAHATRVDDLVISLR